MRSARRAGVRKWDVLQQTAAFTISRFSVDWEIKKTLADENRRRRRRRSFMFVHVGPMKRDVNDFKMCNAVLCERERGTRVPSLNRFNGVSGRCGWPGKWETFLTLLFQPPRQPINKAILADLIDLFFCKTAEIPHFSIDLIGFGKVELGKLIASVCRLIFKCC